MKVLRTVTSEPEELWPGEVGPHPLAIVLGKVLEHMHGAHARTGRGLIGVDSKCCRPFEIDLTAGPEPVIDPRPGREVRGVCRGASKFDRPSEMNLIGAGQTDHGSRKASYIRRKRRRLVVSTHNEEIDREEA